MDRIVERVIEHLDNLEKQQISKSEHTAAVSKEITDIFRRLLWDL